MADCSLDNGAVPSVPAESKMPEASGGQETEGSKGHSSSDEHSKTTGKNADKDDGIYYVDRILSKKTQRINATEVKRSYKVRWLGFGPDDDSWEPEENLPEQVVTDYEEELKVQKEKQKARKKQQGWAYVDSAIGKPKVKDNFWATVCSTEGEVDPHKVLNTKLSRRKAAPVNLTDTCLEADFYESSESSDDDDRPGAAQKVPPKSSHSTSKPRASSGGSGSKAKRYEQDQISGDESNSSDDEIAPPVRKHALTKAELVERNRIRKLQRSSIESADSGVSQHKPAVATVQLSEEELQWLAKKKQKAKHKAVGDEKGVEKTARQAAGGAENKGTFSFASSTEGHVKTASKDQPPGSVSTGAKATNADIKTLLNKTMQDMLQLVQNDMRFFEGVAKAHTSGSDDVIKRAEITKDLNAQLHTAVLAGSLDAVKNVLKMHNDQGIILDLVQPYSAGHTLLMTCALRSCSTPWHNYCEIMDLLIAAGASSAINAQNEAGETALTFAVRKNQECKVVKLLKRNAQVNTVNIRGESALTIASKHAHARIVKWLLKSGADVNFRQGMQTSLDIAQLKNRSQATSMLKNQILRLESKMKSAVEKMLPLDKVRILHPLFPVRNCCLADSASYQFKFAVKMENMPVGMQRPVLFCVLADMNLTTFDRNCCISGVQVNGRIAVSLNDDSSAVYLNHLMEDNADNVVKISFAENNAAMFGKLMLIQGWTLEPAKEGS